MHGIPGMSATASATAQQALRTRAAPQFFRDYLQSEARGW
jgi:hypothetical protein